MEGEGTKKRNERGGEEKRNKGLNEWDGNKKREMIEEGKRRDLYKGLNECVEGSGKGTKERNE